MRWKRRQKINKRFKELMACTEKENRIEKRMSYIEAKRGGKERGNRGKKLWL